MRHAESIYTPGTERARGLTGKGERDAALVRQLLKDVPVDLVLSSPYYRAVRTVQDVAEAAGLEIISVEDLRERQLSGEEFIASQEQFRSAKRRVYEDKSFAFPGGESSEAAQRRAIRALLPWIGHADYRHIVVGTHGDIMTLMLNDWDASYDCDFWASTTMPDMYKLHFEGQQLNSVTRLWAEETVSLPE
ncbi:histidine phosphatase family protein [Paenibacillus doosanensis]|uniref:Bifunctional RNase H/acid phosphatase n=1 Tax=Paenibacillus konkukensis TaxID=2020716 RepID=A0ABY4S2T1_9BACL|nr:MULTISPECIES: histidine phosphatase family protein [Paenibacillus]MCS7463337.1 histidine phosphatase family protein [Paenibacillus doosanensis]UQZ87643.1 bifunctional RNase H/acid phosphatase [Paenibacillus konkukensis]